MTGRKMLVAGAGDTAAATAELVGGSGGHGFALVWTHPEYPIGPGRDEEPPAGTPVTRTAVASYRASANRLARGLGIDRRHGGPAAEYCSRWAQPGHWHLTLADPVARPWPVAARGALGLWRWDSDA